MQRDPDRWEFRAQLGIALFLEEKYADSEAQLREAVRLAPNQSSCHYWLGQSLLKLGNITEAERAYREAGRLESAKSTEPSATIPSSRNIAVRNSVPDASPVVLPMWPSGNMVPPLSNPATAVQFAEAFNALGNTLFNCQRFDESALAFESASKLAPDNARYLANCASALIKADERDLAVEKAKRAQCLGFEKYWAVDSFWASALSGASRRNLALEKARQAQRMGLRNHWALKSLGLTP